MQCVQKVCLKDADLGGQKVTVQSQQARLANGALAGSILKMNHGLRNLISFTGDTLDHLWRVTSLNQAIALGIDDRKGSIKVNKMQILLF